MRSIATMVVVFTLSCGAAASAQGPRDALPAPEAWDALQRGEAAKAASIFREALDRSPRNAVLHYGAGYAAHLLGRREAALSSLRRALEIDPELVPALFLLARVAYEDGDVELAVRSLEKGVKLYPDSDARRQLEAWRAESSLHRGFGEQPVQHFNILFEGSFDKGISDRAAAVLEAAYWRVGQSFNTYPSEALTVLLYTNKQFRDVTRAPDWSAGRFDGRIRIAVGGALRTPQTLDRVLTHEFVHAVITHAAARGVPAWVHEGLASYFETTDHSWAERVVRTSKIAIPLEDLDDGFGGLDSQTALVAYAESLVAAGLLVRHLGPNLGLFLQMLGSGHTVDQALSTLNVQPDVFRGEWKSRVGIR